MTAWQERLRSEYLNYLDGTIAEISQRIDMSAKDIAGMLTIYCVTIPNILYIAVKTIE